MNNEAQACIQHPKLSDAETMERAAAELDRLSNRARELGMQVEVIYVFGNVAGGTPAKNTVDTEQSEPRVNPNYMRRRARELRAEFDKELAEKAAAAKDAVHFPGRIDGINPANSGGTSDDFIRRFETLATDVEYAAQQCLMHSPPPVHSAFVHTFFSKLQALAKAMEGVDLRGPQ